MGIPKFFRYISERYPLTSQLVQENKIPEFDNLYLDFNGIIHNCSHPNDDDAHFRMSEEQIFTSIFTYVDHLFGKIKPKKFFLMAIDGVAPRAKMNQQRSRRFRTAKEAREVREKAEARGEKLPEEKAFDSNCITPGTEFMAKLSDQLRWFVNKKITEDANWRNVKVVLSGHDVPGEGEHKIMEYIRLSKAQPDYDPNTRHCMYGLDADLIMLGLLSHDPHFCLLREEVKFGPKRNSKNKGAEGTNYYLLHLTLMREYLDLEFRDIEQMLPFDYSLERVIDDFILLAVFVGNDFLPHLPDLHIHDNGLERLFDVYKKVLPSLDGYINESGKINLRRLQVVLDEMKLWEQEIFQKEYVDMNWYKGKQSKHLKEIEAARKRNQLVLTHSQREIFDQVRSFVLQYRNASSTALGNALLTMPNTFPAKDREFITRLADDLHLSLTWDEYDKNDQNLVSWRLPGALEQPLPESGAATPGEEDTEEEDWEDVDEEESRKAVDRVLNKYDKAKVAPADGDGDFDSRYEAGIREKMEEWKRHYYQEKLQIHFDKPEELSPLIYRYVEGLQWVMHYYYGGVASWGWFYDYHYAPRISDLSNIEQLKFDFKLGRPFRPFEQLMGVLPEASKGLIPSAYRPLMFDPSSSILDFYPKEFEQDMNGKKAEWEAIVKIPFIDEERLLNAMSAREGLLTKDEQRRNSFGPSILFSYNPGEPTTYPSSLPGFFPAVVRCTCKEEPFNLPTLDGLQLVEGLLDGVLLGVDALAGFPSLKTLDHVAMLGFHGVNVHNSESRNKSMVVHIKNPREGKKTEDIANELIDQKVFVDWPFLHEGKVVAVSDSLFRYEKVAIVAGGPQKVVSSPHSPRGLGAWKSKADSIQYTYSKKCGVITGDIEVLVHVRPLRGLKRLDDGSFIKDYEDADKEIEQAVQMCVSEVSSEDPRFKERAAPPLSEEFPEGSKIFFLGEHAYGVAAQVSGTTNDTLSVVLAFFPSEKEELAQFKRIASTKSADYFPSRQVANVLKLSPRSLSKITSSFMVLSSHGEKTNLGLSLKFEAKALKVVGYSRKNNQYWEFSEKAVELLREYKAMFPEVFTVLDQAGDDMPRASDMFEEEVADKKIKEVKNWLNSKGVRDFEPVSLFCDQLEKATCSKLQALCDELTNNKVPTKIKKAIVKNIPRQAVLKPSHAVYRLQGQKFALGDRVTMVQDSGGVPLSVKGVVVGLNNKTIDVLWDIPFLSGTTLGGRCPEYRGSSVEFNTCLNLTNPQLITSIHPRPPAAIPDNAPFNPRIGPFPAVQPRSGQQAASGFQAAQQNGSAPITAVHIMSNPSRGRGGVANGHNGSRGRGAWAGHPSANAPVPPETSNSGAIYDDPTNGVPTRGGFRGGSRGGGVPVPGRGGFNANGSPAVRGGPRGRGVIERGRGSPRGGFRGRGRGGAAPAS